MNKYKPDYNIHPYEYLNEILESLEINKKEFFDRMGITEKQADDIGTYTYYFILKLESFLNVSRDIWINLVKNYLNI